MQGGYELLETPQILHTVDHELVYSHCTFSNMPGCSLPLFGYATPYEVTSHGLMTIDVK